MEFFEWDDNEGTNHVDSLKYENTNYCVEREKCSCDVMKKYPNNKHIESS